MTKIELIHAIQASPLSYSGLGDTVPIWQIDNILAALAAVSTKELRKGGEIPLPGLGKLKFVYRQQRNGTNPATGAAIVIPSKRSAKFVPAKALLDALA
ncbi:MAG: HU family DNA-binding protein [Pseudomonadota bacterium]|nr:HU family DNA-binding protein [Pseudomonadota bacterium]